MFSAHGIDRQDQGVIPRARRILLALVSSCDENGGVIKDLLGVVGATLAGATRVRVFDSIGPDQPGRMRRDCRPVLADQRDPEALIQLRAALAVRTDTDVMDWRQWPELWLELFGSDDARLTVVGLLLPGWLRWGEDGDLELQNPRAIMQWLTRWAPEAAVPIAE
ncbi:hypothetical protein AB0873_30105 [Micromonospora sp. NPDC047707]|uniref:hypothetical protein n=1 Tax=Micromonospora sp. NPDC047707 TaxID=3154498 RepID=UPI0034519F6B